MGNSEVEVIFTPWPYDAVARGVALLGEKVPGWRTTRSLERLAFDEDAEPLSLLFGDCLEGCSVLRIDRDAASDYGFDVPTDGTLEDWDTLIQVWREAIAGGSK